MHRVIPRHLKVTSCNTERQPVPGTKKPPFCELILLSLLAKRQLCDNKQWHLYFRMQESPQLCFTWLPPPYQHWAAQATWSCQRYLGSRLAARVSKSQMTSPWLGFTSDAGRGSSSVLGCSTLSTVGAFSSPVMGNTASFALFTTGNVRVTRQGGGLGESVISATHRALSWKKILTVGQASDSTIRKEPKTDCYWSESSNFLTVHCSIKLGLFLC